MNIAFVSGSVKEAEFLYQIADYLKKTYSIESYFVFTREFLYHYFKNKRPGNAFFCPLKAYRLSPEEIVEKLENYTDYNLSLLAFSDPVLCRKNSNYAISNILSNLDFWETFIAEKKITSIAHYPTSTVAGRTSYIAAKKAGIQHLVFQTGPLVNKNFTICDINENWIWSEFLDLYSQKKCTLSEDHKQRIEDLVNRVVSTKSKSLKVRKVSLKTLLTTAFHSLRYRKFDSIEVNEYRKLLTPFFRKALLLFFRYDSIDPQDKYLFFPLHISWDAQIATRNPMFADQVYLVEILSRSLPYGHWLYVKEHPYNYGGERLKILNKIKRLPNVKLIYPATCSLDLIKNSKAVVTINSTAGWESIILKKPVLTFGKTFYASFKYTHTVDDIAALPELIQKISNSAESDTEGHYLPEWYQFLNAVLQTSYDGAAISYKNYMGLGANLVNENIQTTAESIYRKLHEQDR